MSSLSRTLILSALVTSLWLVSAARAATVRIAIAANFTEPAREIADAFRAKTGHDAALSFGASGQLLTQIIQEAPFDVFLSADEERPLRAVEAGFALASSRFTYATGTLALWSREPGMVTGAESLTAGGFARLAIADPAATPYGAAAIAALTALGFIDRLKPTFVTGTTITQTFQFVDTGNAELGFVALSQIMRHDRGSRWIVPASLHPPIRQDAVLLKRGANNEAAIAFMGFLKSPEGRAIIRSFGYGLADP